MFLIQSTTSSTTSRRMAPESALRALPVEIIYDILSRLHPADLLHFSRVSHGTHGVILSRSAEHVWRESFAHMGFHYRTPTLSLPNLASIIFEERCSYCGIYTDRDPLHELGLRLCGGCQDTLVAPGNKILKTFKRFPECDSTYFMVPRVIWSDERRTTVKQRGPQSAFAAWNPTDNGRNHQYFKPMLLYAATMYRQEMESDRASAKIFLKARREKAKNLIKVRSVVDPVTQNVGL
ncbi:hypothetical protein PTI98_000455 [Pleurotus ostreatus]|nr:hypothetical protein PTI98_000455 [Pleurotus ostreatus]